jgi:hypothetical protein
MTRAYTYSHPLPFGDSHWVKKEKVKPLVLAVRRLLDDMYEFGNPSDSKYPQEVEDALQALLYEKDTA